MKQETFTVTEIHCQGCERTIRTLVGDMEGVHDVAPDWRTKRVTVSYDEDLLDPESIRRGLAEAGFPARESAR